MPALLFVIAGLLVLLALSTLYVTLGHVPIVEGLLFGLKAAVLVIVVQALVKVSKRALKGWQSYLVGACAVMDWPCFSCRFRWSSCLLDFWVGLMPDVFGD